MGCSTVVIGKAASTTGTIIVGHNEDNNGRILAAQYRVPPQRHESGETVRFEPGSAAVPQVGRTLGFYWSQTLDPHGASFSDGFVNDKGVVIVSNACTEIFPEFADPPEGGGVGHAVRRLMAERAGSAREAIAIATGLLTEYGYFSEGRTYTIADHREAWQMAILQGRAWAARRVGDDEIVYTPNNFTMDRLDTCDSENVILSPGLLERAAACGRYRPGDRYFNFRAAVQPAEKRAADYNAMRSREAWKRLAGLEINDPELFPCSVTAKRKFSPGDVIALLRSHEAGIGDVPGWYHARGHGLCRPTTHESAVYVLDECPELIKGYRTYAEPCETPYVPLFPLAGPPRGASFLDWKSALAGHFTGDPALFCCRPDWPVWSFVRHANTVDYEREEIGGNAEFLKELEEKLGREDAGGTARSLLAASRDKALAYLADYNTRMFSEAEAAVSRRTRMMSPHRAVLLSPSIDAGSEETVDFALLSDETLDAASADIAETRAGVGRASIGSMGRFADLARPVSHRLEDVDGDGRKDLVLAFRQSEMGANMLGGALYDVWLYTVAGGRRLALCDTALIKTKGKQGRAEDADR